MIWTLLTILHSYHTPMDRSKKKTSTLETNAAKTGLRINKEKTKVMRLNTKNVDSIETENKQLENITSFTYLGSIVNTLGGTDKDVRSRIAKANVAFGMLRKVWKSRQLTEKNFPCQLDFNLYIKHCLICIV